MAESPTASDDFPDTGEHCLTFETEEDEFENWFSYEDSPSPVNVPTVHETTYTKFSRASCLSCVLLCLLPWVYLAGFYSGKGYRGDASTSGRNDALVLTDTGMNDPLGTSSPATFPPTLFPSSTPSSAPSLPPSSAPSSSPSEAHSKTPTSLPSVSPTMSPSKSPTSSPSQSPTANPTKKPTLSPTATPSLPPTGSPTLRPTTWISTNKLESGPLVGHVTDSSARLWAQHERGRSMKVVYRATRGNTTELTVTMRATPSRHAATADIEDLAPDTRYKYQIRRNNDENELLATGEFRTAKPANEPIAFDYLLASCMNARSKKGYTEQPVWDVIRSERNRLDFAILAGDNVYLNSGDWTNSEGVQVDRVLYRHVVQRRESYFAQFIAKTPIYSTWDDHDFGDNDSDMTQRGKNNSLYAFENVWANPSYGTRNIPGVFYTFSRGDVQFFVLDNRYHRDPNSGSQFGPAQKDWLYDGLKSSTATFKIIVSASSLMERDWTNDIMDIGKVVDQNSISGVLFNTGDIHRNEFKAKDRMGRWPYKVTQITSSGIARVWKRPFALIRVDTHVSDPTITVNFYAAVNENDNTSWENDPRLSCSEDVEDGDRDNEHRCTEVIRLSDLTP